MIFHIQNHITIMGVELSGTLIAIYDVNQVNPTFKKQEAVIRTGGQYPQELKIQCLQDKVGLLEHCRLGDEITCTVDISGKGYQNAKGEMNYFNNLNCWKLTRTAYDRPTTQAATPPPPPAEAPPASGGQDDLPF